MNGVTDNNNPDPFVVGPTRAGPTTKPRKNPVRNNKNMNMNLKKVMLKSKSMKNLRSMMKSRKMGSMSRKVFRMKMTN